MQFKYRMFILFISVSFFMACNAPSNIIKPENQSVENTINANGVNLPPILPQECCINPPVREQEPLDDPASILAKRSIYFDDDGYSVRDEYLPMIEAHSRYLLVHEKRKIIIVGNTDERGSREYNLSLGQKRAESVHRQFMLRGVSEAQIETITYGEERPKLEGHDETAWAENRRVDIRYE